MAVHRAQRVDPTDLSPEGLAARLPCEFLSVSPDIDGYREHHRRIEAWAISQGVPADDAESVAFQILVVMGFGVADLFRYRHENGLVPRLEYKPPVPRIRPADTEPVELEESPPPKKSRPRRRILQN